MRQGGKSRKQVPGTAGAKQVDQRIDTRVPRTDTVDRLATTLRVERCWLAYGDGKAPEGWRIVDEPNVPR